MRLPSGYDLPESKISAFCEKWGVTRLEIFGSALTQDFHKDSDLDFLVSFATDSNRGLNFFEAADDLSQSLLRKVDLVSKTSLSKSRNKYRTKRILASAQAVYVRA